MSRFFSEKYDRLIPYTPGEQPQGRKYIKLNTNESPFLPSPRAQALAREAAEQLQLYSDPECRALRERMAHTLGHATEEIIFTNGSDEVLNFAFMAFCDETHPAAFADITYGFYKVFAQVNNIPYQTIPLREDLTICVEDYLGIHKTIFIANPNAPTGLALSRADIERIAAANPDNVVVVDEAYVDFGAESAASLIRHHDNILVTQTFSKSRSLAGGRLGFGIGSKELIQDLNTIRYSTNPYNVNRMTMAAGIGALEDGDYFRKNCETIMATRRWTTGELRALGFELADSMTNFVFARHPAITGGDLYRRLKERGILVRHFDSRRLTEYNRITIGSMEDMQTLVSTVKDILEEQK
ncbi:MAG: histidinol-phosphate transaminase [Oscillospiraceae bacterium]|nr:histidinol-phosphate transaminase [Oscillospiraceae bacterium]